MSQPPQTASRARRDRPMEVLAPAGDDSMMRAAASNGADSVYFGLERFNARMRASNFRADDLPRIMEWLHERAMKGYVTVNTLVFTDEMEQVLQQVIRCGRGGADAVIVQDLGVGALAARAVPGLPVHASTQMTIASAAGIHAVRALGVPIARAIVARELSLAQIAALCADRHGVEIEVFVHGALCISYSGQCLASEVFGGRSANRGECAQACRLPYHVLVDGRPVASPHVAYPVSPLDLEAGADAAGLAAAGVSAVKIEGRLKSPEYVAAAVQHYRAAVDGAPRNPDAAQRLELTFSRGFCSGFLHGTDHAAVVEGAFPGHRGVRVGRVVRHSSRGIHVAMTAPLRVGDGVALRPPNRDLETPHGGLVREIRMGGASLDEYRPHPGDAREVVLVIGSSMAGRTCPAAGDEVWKTSDSAIDRSLRESFARDAKYPLLQLDAVVRGGPGSPLEVEWTDSAGHRVVLSDTQPAETAVRMPLTREVLLAQLGRMGNTPFRLKHLDARIDGEIMVPVSRLNALRRRSVQALLAAHCPPEPRGHSANALRELRAELQAPVRSSWWRKTRMAGTCAAPGGCLLTVLCRTAAQVEAAANDVRVGAVCVDASGDSPLLRACASIDRTRSLLIAATPRILKQGEEDALAPLLALQPDAVLARSLAAWWLLRQMRPDITVLGDHSLNIANDISAGLLLKAGFAQVMPALDLDVTQFLGLLGHVPSACMEVPLHLHAPMFHMEHCLYCRFLGHGTTRADCGRPCMRHALCLEDRKGFRHPVGVDALCRNTVYSAVPQSPLLHLPRLLRAGIVSFRIELVNEDEALTRHLIDAYAHALDGTVPCTDTWAALRDALPTGLTRGTWDPSRMSE